MTTTITTSMSKKRETVGTIQSINSFLFDISDLEGGGCGTLKTINTQFSDNESCYSDFDDAVISELEDDNEPYYRDYMHSSIKDCEKGVPTLTFKKSGNGGGKREARKATPAKLQNFFSRYGCSSASNSSNASSSSSSRKETSTPALKIKRTYVGRRSLLRFIHFLIILIITGLFIFNCKEHLNLLDVDKDGRPNSSPKDKLFTNILFYCQLAHTICSMLILLVLSITSLLPIVIYKSHCKRFWIELVLDAIMTGTLAILGYALVAYSPFGVFEGRHWVAGSGALSYNLLLLSNGVSLALWITHLAFNFIVGY